MGTKPLSVLLVDDDPGLSEMFSLCISAEAPHFRIYSVGGGKECLEYIASREVDCILSDYQMPGMNGMQLLQALRRKGNTVPFIFVTGQGNEEVARDAFMNGADDYFTKDIGFAHFARIINSIEQSVIKRKAELVAQKAEAALRESEARYHSFVANSSEAIWRFELESPVPTWLPEDEQIALFYRDGRLAECNDAAARMFGFDSPEEFIGRRLSDIQPSSDPRNIEGLRAFIRSGYRLVDNESYNLDRYGRMVCLRNSYLGMVENGLLARAWGVSRDITRLKQVEEAIVRSNTALKEILDGVSFGILVVGCDRVIKMVNKTALSMMGYEAETDIVGKACETVVCSAELGKCPILGMGMPINLSESVILTSRGERVPVLKSVSSISLEGQAALLETLIEKIRSDPAGA